MARRYAHLAAGNLAVYADKAERHGTDTARPPDFCGTAIPPFQHVERDKMISEKPNP